ncbi:MAG: enoyl-CoA hydratase-related protein [Polyangiales bacterium]|jgi:enoyl-CoA hydratase/carnithine racemase
MSDPLVLTSLDPEGVLTLTMNRPSRRNAFNSEAFLALGHAFTEANSDPRVAVALLTGAGDDFSSGLDLAAIDMGSDGEPPFERMMDAICAFEKPLVCAAKGCAIGFGATVLFHADVVYLGQSTKLRFPFASLGLVTEAAAAYLGPAMIGHKQAAELLFTAEFFDAEKALEYGIATRVLPDETLLPTALEKAREMAQWPIDSLVEIKRIMKSMHGDNVARARKLEMDGFQKLMGSPANMEAFTAFMERRAPDFKQFRK